MRTRTKVLLGIGTLLSLPIFGILSLVAFGYGYLIYDVNAHTEDLRFVNRPAHDFCQNISLNPKFTEGPVYFRVDRRSLIIETLNRPYSASGYEIFAISLVGWWWPYGKTIVLTEESLRSTYLDVIVAHELGHIQNISMGKESADLKERENQADAFAAEMVGIQRVLEFRRAVE